jgi:hypothetical protein
MATAVIPGTTVFDPHSVDLGPQTGVPRFYFGEVPFGAILRADRANGVIYAVYTTDRTTSDYLDEMWEELPHSGLCYQMHLRCKKVPPDWRRQAEVCFIHYYTTHRRGILAGIDKTQFLSTQRVF